MPPAPSSHTGQNDRPDQETLLYRPADRSIGHVRTDEGHIRAFKAHCIMTSSSALSACEQVLWGGLFVAPDRRHLWTALDLSG
jgi:hypothetical protein